LLFYQKSAVEERDKLNITYDTVRAHMKKIYERLHVASMTEAVAKAINQQLFSGK
jgi:DNA-binding NarL/FixJ family response regulator